MVIGSFASYTKIKSAESAVWCLLTLDDDGVEQAVVNRYWYIAVMQDRNTWTEFRFRIVLFPFEQQSKQNSMKMKQNNRTTNNDWWIITNTDEQTIITNTSNDYD